MVNPAVFPQATTAPNQTTLTRIVAQPDLARSSWTVETRRLAVVSYSGGPLLESGQGHGAWRAPSPAGHRDRNRQPDPSKTVSGIQLGEAGSRLLECLVQLLWVGEEGHHQGVDHREPTQPLLFVATQRLREHQVQVLKKRKDGLVVHHEACLSGDITIAGYSASNGSAVTNCAGATPRPTLRAVSFEADQVQDLIALEVSNQQAEHQSRTGPSSTVI